MIEKVADDATEYAVIIRKSYKAEGIQFVTAKEYAQQQYVLQQGILRKGSVSHGKRAVEAMADAVEEYLGRRQTESALWR